MTEEGYRLGRVDLIRLLDAQRALLESQLAAAEAEASWDGRLLMSRRRPEQTSRRATPMRRELLSSASVQRSPPANAGAGRS